MTRWPASWAGDSVEASAASGLCTTAGAAAVLRTLVTDAGAFLTPDATPDAGRCVAECDVAATGPALAFAANTMVTAAATQVPLILSQCCWRNARIAS